MEGNSKKTIVGNYQLTTRIGCGAYAEVFKGVDLRTENDVNVAIKVIARNKIGHPKLQENLQSEIAILRHFNHINIVRLVDHFNSSKYIFLVLELCEGGDLSKYIKKYKSISEEISIRFLKQIASGLLFLSHKSLIHRDLKPANILLTEFSENAILKLADFGFAKELKDADTMTQTRCGTPLYMSPEVLENLEYDSKIDIWSAGVIFYEMLVGNPPFKGANEVDLLKNIKTKSLSLPSNIHLSKESIMLMKGLLERNPVRRISLENFCDTLSHFTLSDEKVNLVDKPFLDNNEMNSSTSTKQRVSDVNLNPSAAATMMLTVKGHSVSGQMPMYGSSNPNNTITNETNARAGVTTHRRYSSDQSDILTKTKNNQKNWLPVSSIGSNLGKAIISFAQPSYKSNNKNRVRSSSADTVIDGFYSGFGRPQQIKAFKNDVSAEEDFVIIDSNFSQSQKKKETPPPFTMEENNDAILKHLQSSNHLCDIINVIVSIADNLIKDAKTPQLGLDSVETDEKRSRGNSIDCQYINACSLYLHVLQLLNDFILTQNSMAIFNDSLQQISSSLFQYVDILIMRVEQCSKHFLSFCDSSPCIFPTSPELLLYKAAIKIANDATVEELLGNLENALNSYLNARTLLQYVIAKVHDHNDKNTLKNSLKIISSKYDVCKELHFLSRGT